MSVAEQEQREVEVVVGAVTGVTQKRADTWTITVQPDGSQYTKNLWTKDAGLVAQIPQFLNQRLAFTCGASHWTNQQGQPVRSLWVNEVAQASPEGVVQTIAPQVQQQQAALVEVLGPTTPAPVAQLPQPSPLPAAAPAQAPDDRETKIMRQAAAKCAVGMLASMPTEERTFPHLVLNAEGWFAYFTRGPSAIQGVPPTGEVQGTGPIMMAPTPAQFAADDIPF